MKKLSLLFAILFSFQFLFAEPQNGVVYVKSGATGTGESWDSALGDIQEAISLARTQDPEARKDVWVAGGEYEIEVAINIMDSVNVYGSFQGTETEVAQRPKPELGNPWEFQYPTILKGKGERIMHAVAVMDMETTIDGFIMQDGNGISSRALNGSGGAIVVRGGVVYQNCILRNNIAGAGFSGGAAIMTGGTIRYCLVENNEHVSGSNGGGGIFSNPAAGYPSYIEHCVVRGNSSGLRGSGIGVQGVEMTYVSNCEIYNNVAIDGTTPKPGAGIYANSANNRISNCLIYNNSGGTAVYYNGGNFYNNTVVKNAGGLYLAGNAVKAINNIVWGCATDATGTTATSITGVANNSWEIKNNATYNPIPTDKGWIIDGNIQFSSNMTNGDVAEPAPGTVGSGPKFLKPSNFIGAALTEENLANLDSVNWRLNGFSPCIDGGMTVEEVVEDFYGSSRPQGFPVETAQYDIGAYELPYFFVVAGEAESANGTIYTGMGEIVSENQLFGIPLGGELEFYLESADGYKVDRVYYKKSTDGGVTFNGEEVDVTDKLDEDGFLKLTVDATGKLVVVWKSLSGLKKLDNSVIQCYNIGNGIQINGVSLGEHVRVYNITGMLVKELNASDENIMIPLQQGMYVVRLAEGAQKVIVK